MLKAVLVALMLAGQPGAVQPSQARTPAEITLYDELKASTERVVVLTSSVAVLEARVWRLEGDLGDAEAAIASGDMREDALIERAGDAEARAQRNAVIAGGASGAALGLAVALLVIVLAN